MKVEIALVRKAILLGAFWLVAAPGIAQEEPAQLVDDSLEVETPASAEAEDLELERRADEPAADEPVARDTERSRRHRRRDAIVRIGSNAHLGAQESANAVVSFFGSSTSEGRVREAVVSIFGTTRVTGRTGEAIAVFGDTYVNGEVRGEAVAVFGDLHLGPKAKIYGEATVVGGHLDAHPDAVIYGGIEEVSLGGNFGQFLWLRPWIDHALLFGRPLAMEPGLKWAWVLAFGFLGLYVLIALLFGESVEKCVRTLESRPGETTVASLLAVLLVPVVMILLLITVIGIAVIPFLAMGLFVAGLFGKAVVLAALGRRVTRFVTAGPFAHVAFAVLIGGLLAMGIYLVPVLGFIAYKVIGILGLGVVIYTLMLASRMRDRPLPAQPNGDVTAMTMSAGSAAIAEASIPFSMTDSEAAETPSVPPVAAALPRADFWIRMAALLIDAVLVGIIASMIPGSGDIWLLALAIYGALMWRLRGTTVGGIVCNLRVVRLDGAEIDWATAIVRALGCFLSLVVVGLGFIWIALDPGRQAWHDKIAGTVVVRVPKGKPLV